MRRITITGLALLAVLTTSTTIASTASAKRLTLFNEGDVTLLPGDAFEVQGFDALRVETSKGPIECESTFLRTGFEVSVITNSRWADMLQIKQLEGRFLEGCRSFTGDSEVELASLGEIFKLTARGEATVGPASIVIYFNRLRGQEAECFYSATKLKGTDNATPSLEPLRVALGGKLTRDVTRSTSRFCPSKTEVNLQLPLTVTETSQTFESIFERTTN